jgi:hypothetical protein
MQREQMRSKGVRRCAPSRGKRAGSRTRPAQFIAIQQKMRVNVEALRRVPHATSDVRGILRSRVLHVSCCASHAANRSLHARLA